MGPPALGSTEGQDSLSASWGLGKLPSRREPQNGKDPQAAVLEEPWGQQDSRSLSPFHTHRSVQVSVGKLRYRPP